MFLEDDNLLIVILIALGICLTMDAGWLELRCRAMENLCVFIFIHFDIYKSHSIPKSKFRKILVENITIITHEIDKLRLQIQEAVHTPPQKKTPKKTKNKQELVELTFIIATMLWNAFSPPPFKKKFSVSYNILFQHSTH